MGGDKRKLPLDVKSSQLGTTPDQHAQCWEDKRFFRKSGPLGASNTILLSNIHVKGEGQFTKKLVPRSKGEGHRRVMKGVPTLPIGEGKEVFTSHVGIPG